MKNNAAFALLISCLLLSSFFAFGCTGQQSQTGQTSISTPELPPLPKALSAKPLKGSTGASEMDELEKALEEAASEESGQGTQPETPPETQPSTQPETQPTQQPPSSSGGVETSGNYVAALNYKVKVDGFSFENYDKSTPERKNLGADEVQKFFGKEACANTQGACILTPPAKQWAEQNNKGMDDGHCEGMATLSLLFNLGTRSANDFGAGTAYELKIDNNDKLQREIAYWFATQTTEPTSSSMMKMAPNDILDKLSESFKSGGTPESYTLGIYKRDKSGGHAITPFAIEDRGEGVFWILVYDNNYQGENRAVIVDRNANTWRYSASINPSVAASDYDGDATTKNLEITPTSARLKPQVCPFCGGETAAAGGEQKGSMKGAAASYNEIWIDGNADVLATDSNGKRLGIAAGAVVEEMPGARYIARKAASPVYQIPTGTSFTLSIDAARLKKTSETDIVMIGPGYDIGIQNITLAPGKKSTALFSPTGNSLTYTSAGTESPDIIYGISTASDDYEFFIKGVELQTGASVVSALDTAKGRLSIGTKGNSKSGKFFFQMNRIDDAGEVSFGNDEGIELAPGETIYFNYAKWSGNKGSLTIEIYDSNNTLVDSQELKDTD